MKRRNYLYWPRVAFLVALSGLAIPALSQETSRSRYEVSDDKGRVTTVATSASKDAVVVSLHREGQPTHHYRASPPTATITVQVERQTAFTYYINLGRIDVRSFAVAKGRPSDASFTVELSKVSGPERRQRKDIAAVREGFVDDMRVLRAVRGYDKDADVLLAELAYVVLTYDDSIMDGKPPASLTVRQTTPEPDGERVSAASSAKARP
ncbi:MAG TPA: hypothetical protein VF588_10830 [Pyrinomonadaceae bacterium]|jgi:hypothetical protein